MEKKKRKEIVRCAIISLGKVNKKKKNLLKEISIDSKRITQEYINIFWKEFIENKYTIYNYNVNLPSYANAGLYEKITSDKYSARFLQICATKALSHLKPLCKKQNKRKFIYSKLRKEGKSNFGRDAEKVKKRNKILQNMIKVSRVFNKINSHSPVIKHFSFDLNGNFIKNNFNSNSKTMFKNWITITNIYQRRIKKPRIHLPIIKTKIFNKFIQQNYNLSNYLQITDTGLIKVVFRKEINNKVEGDIRGCDVGMINVWSLDNGEASENRQCGLKTHNLQNILVSLKKKIKKSNGKRKRRTMRDQFVNWSINQLDLSNIKTLKLENLKNMKYKCRVNRTLTAWKGTYLIHKLESRCEELGIEVIKVNPRYTSQRCSSCGWVYKKNRQCKLYKCNKCNLEIDADINGAKNILYLNKTDNIIGDNIKGFYYNH